MRLHLPGTRGTAAVQIHGRSRRDEWLAVRRSGWRYVLRQLHLRQLNPRARVESRRGGIRLRETEQGLLRRWWPHRQRRWSGRSGLQLRPGNGWLDLGSFVGAPHRRRSFLRRLLRLPVCQFECGHLAVDRPADDVDSLGPAGENYAALFPNSTDGAALGFFMTDISVRPLEIGTTIPAVPEPSTLWAMSFGLGLVGLCARRRPWKHSPPAA